MKMGKGFPSRALGSLGTLKAGGSGRLVAGVGAVPFRRLHVSQPGGVGCRFSPVFHVKLTEDVFDVGFNGIFGHHQRIGQPGIGEAPGNQPQNLLLPGSQLGFPGQGGVRGLRCAGIGGLPQV